MESFGFIFSIHYVMNCEVEPVLHKFFQLFTSEKKKYKEIFNSFFDSGQLDNLAFLIITCF